MRPQLRYPLTLSLSSSPPIFSSPLRPSLSHPKRAAQVTGNVSICEDTFSDSCLSLSLFTHTSGFHQINDLVSRARRMLGFASRVLWCCGCCLSGRTGLFLRRYYFYVRPLVISTPALFCFGCNIAVQRSRLTATTSNQQQDRE